LVRLGIRVEQIIDLTEHTEKRAYLEGTGSLVLDHTNRFAFLAQSNRSDAALAREWCTMMNYQLIPFNTILNPNGVAVYHTNVVMAIFSECAIVCKDIIEPMDQSKVLSNLQFGGRKLIEIDLHQMSCFAGNMIERQHQAQKRFFIMSQTAHQALNVSQITALENHGALIISNIQTIERSGGGGVRCMIAELFDDNNSK